MIISKSKNISILMSQPKSHNLFIVNFIDGRYQKTNLLTHLYTVNILHLHKKVHLYITLRLEKLFLFFLNTVPNIFTYEN